MESESTAYTGWAIVELLGRRRYAGHVTEVVQFGVAMGRLDVPETADAPAQTIFFGGESVYQLSPVSEEAAKAVAQYSRPEPVHTFELTPKMKAVGAPRFWCPRCDNVQVDAEGELCGACGAEVEREVHGDDDEEGDRHGPGSAMFAKQTADEESGYEGPPPDDWR